MTEPTDNPATTEPVARCLEALARVTYEAQRQSMEAIEPMPAWADLQAPDRTCWLEPEQPYIDALTAEGMLLTDPARALSYLLDLDIEAFLPAIQAVWRP